MGGLGSQCTSLKSTESPARLLEMLISGHEDLHFPLLRERPSRGPLPGMSSDLSTALKSTSLPLFPCLWTWPHHPQPRLGWGSKRPSSCTCNVLTHSPTKPASLLYLPTVVHICFVNPDCISPEFITAPLSSPGLSPQLGPLVPLHSYSPIPLHT